MAYALIFSGQGAQHPGMLPWLEEDEVVLDMQARLGVDDWRRSLEDSNWAARNANAQVLLIGLALAAWRQMAQALPAPAAVAGYSVGELAAFCAAGVLDSSDALALASRRAAAMDQCAQTAPATGLLGISGLPEPLLQRLLSSAGLALSIRNGIESVVLGGTLPALELAERLAVPQGAHCTRLRVNLASHTPWMRGAAEGFAQTLEGVPFGVPTTALFTNAADRVRDGPSARSALAEQISRTVQWASCMENIHARQVHCVLEIGPGQALARLWNQRYPEVPARACDDFRSLGALLAWVRTHAAAG